MVLGWLIYALWFGCSSTWADTTLVPLPVVTTDPHERETYGALLAILNKQDGALRSLLVPQATWNSLLGARGAAYYQYLLTPADLGVFRVAGFDLETTFFYARFPSQRSRFLTTCLGIHARKA